MEKGNKESIFEKDGDPSHISKSNKALLEKCFGKNWIQNPQNSPDLAYPIEILWGISKETIKKRLAKNREELIQYTFEEWYSVPQSLVENLCNNYIKRIQMVLQNNGARLEKEHLNELREKKMESEKNI